jgi:hypothetical protein
MVEVKQIIMQARSSEPQNKLKNNNVNCIGKNWRTCDSTNLNFRVYHKKLKGDKSRY